MGDSEGRRGTTSEGDNTDVSNNKQPSDRLWRRCFLADTRVTRELCFLYKIDFFFGTMMQCLKFEGVKMPPNISQQKTTNAYHLKQKQANDTLN